MRTMRKLLTFMLAAGLMLSTMTVFASGGYSYTQTSMEDWPAWEEEDIKSDVWFTGTYWQDGNPLGPIYDGSGIESLDSSDSSDSDSSGSRHKSEAEVRRIEEEKECRIQEQASREAVLLEGEAKDEGFENGAQMQAAREESKSVGEFYNNAVLDTPGIENAVTVAQDGNLVVDGQVTNMTANISKVMNRAYVDSVRATQTGTVLNVVDVSYPAVNATINFYMPSITGTENIVALQYNAGTWVNVDVAEVRADHVTLNMTGNGVVAFIAQ